MLVHFHAAKGGAGTTTVVAIAALAAARARPVLLVDLAGDLPALTGVDVGGRPGVADWLASGASAEQLAELVIDDRSTRGEGVHLLPTGQRTLASGSDNGERWRDLAAWCRRWTADTSGVVLVDGGTTAAASVVSEQADRRLLVTRPCYLALVAASRATTVRPDGVVLVDEPGRALRPDDVARSVGAPGDPRVPLDPGVARSVDAGLLLCRPPRSTVAALRRITAEVRRPSSVVGSEAADGSAA